MKLNDIEERLREISDTLRFAHEAEDTVTAFRSALSEIEELRRDIERARLLGGS